MKNKDSLLGIFQDPLLMLIALILLWTLPIIIPRETSPSPQTYETQVKIENLRKEIEDLDSKIDKLHIDLQRLKEDFDALEKIIGEKKSDANKKLNQLRQKIITIKRIIEQKTDELQNLEERWKEVKKQGRETKIMQELEQKIISLKEKIKDNKTLLNRLRQKLDKFKEAEQELDNKLEKQKKDITMLSEKIDIEEDKISSLKNKKNNLENMLRDGGIGEYTKEAVADKNQVPFEAFRNKLVSINDDNYNIKSFRDMYGGHIVGNAELTRKDSVQGEAAEKIAEEDSNFRTKLDRLDPEKDYLKFMVRKDSFEVFLKAREIAWKRNFVVSWYPLEGPIYSSPFGGDDTGR